MAEALLLINIQNDCFAGGACALDDADDMAANAAALLARFRQLARPVFHVQHLFADPAAGFFIEGTDGAKLHPRCRPSPGEPVIVKRHPNGFRDSDLGARLASAGVGHVVIAGAMTHICVDATTRHAVDRGYRCTVVHDACAAASVEFAGRRVPAPDVHAAFMAALAFGYADVVTTRQYLST